MSMIRLQTASYTDGLTDDGEQLLTKPYPFFVSDNGSIHRYGFQMAGRIVGFQRDLNIQDVDLFWAEAMPDLTRAIGMYVVYTDNNGNFVSSTTVVESVETTG